MEYSGYEGADAGIVGAAIAFLIGMFWVLTAIWVISIIGMWKTFEKAGRPGWAALIPIYNVVVMIEIVGKPMIWLLWCLLPCVNWIFMVWLTNLFSKSYGKEEGFTIGLIFLPFIFWPILGFDSSKYLGPSAAEARAFGNQFPPNNPYHQPPADQV
ncbi:MAG: DUF5684 domain-containing protein [Pedobacter sp.]|nr:DUF5684 domain-containing protein [Pedobacter sp.]MDQ8053104.1 DUF5684 domain-containing protein [Pedobacter sp.]